jgi:Uma2 family endonuclease
MIDTTAHPNRLHGPASLAQERRLLENGDRLTRTEFERRYAAMPHIKTAELIEGVVHMPSPVRHTTHGKPHFYLITWLGAYCAATPGVDASDNATLRLDWRNEVQPDVLLRLAVEARGRSRISEDGYVEGAPELVAEIASSSAAIDLHRKLRVYLRSGVQEYLVWRTLDQQLDWFELREGEYVPLEPDEQGRLRSRVFPGLWLAVRPLLEGDLATVLAELRTGLAADEHTAFVQRSSLPRLP